MSLKRIFLSLLFIVGGHSAQAMDYDFQKVTNKNGHTLNVVYMLGVVDLMEVRRWLFLPNQLDSSLDTLFVLNSPGGAIPTGLFVINTIEEFIANQEANHRKTWIVIDGQCASMCVPLFFAWPHRFAVKDTKIGLHGVSNPDETRFYLDNMIKSAKARGEADALNWLNQKISNGEFWSTKLTRHSAQDVAKENGLLKSDGIVDSIPELIDQL